MSDAELEETIRLLRVLEDTLRAVVLGSKSDADIVQSSGQDTPQVA